MTLSVQAKADFRLLSEIRIWVILEFNAYQRLGKRVLKKKTPSSRGIPAGQK